MFVFLALLVSSCSAVNNANSPEPSDKTQEQITETPTTDLWYGSDGDTFFFTQADSEGGVLVKNLGAGKCQFPTIGCDQLGVGDRTVVLELTISNDGPDAIEIDSSMFEVEFPNGTRVDTSTGNAYQFSPDNVFESRTIRAGGKYLGTLTFEAPRGKFSLIMLTDSYGGEDLAIWELE